MCRGVTKSPLMSICPPVRGNKRYMFAAGNSLAYSSGSPVTIFFEKRVKTCKMCPSTRGSAGMIKTECYNHFGAPNLQHHTDNVCAVPRPPLMSTIPPNMLTNWHKFGFHRPTYTRVLLTALEGIGKREKTSRRWSRNVANFK